jgi:hypothetical protein
MHLDNFHIILYHKISMTFFLRTVHTILENSLSAKILLKDITLKNSMKNIFLKDVM